MSESIALNKHQKSQEIISKQMNEILIIIDSIGAYGNKDLIDDLTYIYKQLEEAKNLSNQSFWHMLRNE